MPPKKDSVKSLAGEKVIKITSSGAESKVTNRRSLNALKKPDPLVLAVKDRPRRSIKHSSNLQSESIALHNRIFNLDTDFYNFNFAMRHLPMIETASAILYIFKQLQFDTKYNIPATVLTR